MRSSRGQYTSAPLYNMKSQMSVPGTIERTGGVPAAPVRRNRRCAPLSIVMSVGLPILFLLALFIPSFPLRLVFLGLTLLCVALMWALRAFSPSARSTLSLVYAALFVVVALAMFISMQTLEDRKTSTVIADPQEVFSAEAAPNALNSLLQAPPTETPEPDIQIASAAQQRLESFLHYWAENNITEMLALCTPSWVAQQQSPEGELWTLMLNRRPVQYQIESAPGSDLDFTRTITLKVSFAKEGSSETTLNRIQVLMFRSNELWYVDPQSLGGIAINEEAEQQKLAQWQQQNGFIGSTIAPTVTPAPEGSEAGLRVYYNPDGGKYYHAKANCSAVRESDWPLTGIYYSELNSTKYKKLLRCPTCNPPERP